MTNAGYAVEGIDEVLPDVPLARQRLPASGRQPVVAAPALPWFFDPAAVDEVLLLHAVEGGIERGGVKGDLPPGSLVDQAGEVVTVPVPLLEQREDQQFRAATFELALKPIDAHMWAHHIWNER